MIMHEKCMKSRNKLEKEGQKGLTGLQGQKPCRNHEIKCKGKGKRDLLALKDKNLAKTSEENDKKSLVEP